MIKGGVPTAGVMATFTVSATDNVLRGLTIGDAAVVATYTRTDDLIMIHSPNRRPTDRRMARLTAVAAANMTV